jgi:nucleoside phosphorylase
LRHARSPIVAPRPPRRGLATYRDPLVAALLQQAPLELNAEDVADALWLATLTGPAELQRAPSAPDPSRPVVPGDPASPTGPAPTGSDPPAAPTTHQGTAEAVLPTERLATASVPFRSPTAAALPDALALGRALRPLRRRVPSPTRAVLDENATATFVADTSGRLWLPVLRPAMSRWLDLALVVEDSLSMRLWSRTIAELELLFQFNGAFRNIYPWRLTGDGPLRLFSGRDQSATAARDHRELFDSSGRRAIVIVSDCVSAAWYDGTLSAWLAAWARRSPVAVLQVLPQRLWTRTALRRGLPAMFSAATPAASNRRLSPRYIAAPPAPGDDVIALPVMTLEATSVAAWARTVAGLSGTIEGVALPNRGRQTSGVARITGAAPTAAARVARFRETSTAPAKLLASCLAAVPINLPIVRLVRAAAVPEARDSDLAELFLGGLLREVAADDDPDRVEYDFHDGVRELLLDFVPTGKALHVLDRVSAYIEPRIGQTRDFPAQLTEVTEAGASFAQRHRSFAVLAARVFDRLGDDWSDAAARLQQHAGSPLPGHDVGGAASTRFFDEKAAQYEQIRRQQRAGRERTAILDALIDDVVRHAQRHAIAPGEILALYATGRDGARVVALGSSVGAPHTALVTTIGDAIGTPRSRFELWWALQAARVAIEKLGALRAEHCVATTLDQLTGPSHMLNQRPDSASTRLAEAVVDEFQRAIGLSSARFWIDAGAGRQGTGRCVAILGSDPPGTHLAFSRALGARLAAHGWKVVSGEGYNVGPEMIESFLAAGGPTGEATLYSMNMFEGNDGMRRHMIASADAAVVIAGGHGTAIERDIARREGIPIVTVGFTGGTAAKTAAELFDETEDSDSLSELAHLLNAPRDPSISAEIAVRLLHLRVRDRPKASIRNDAFKLHDADGIRQSLAAANRGSDDEILDLINIFATSRQRTWLVAMYGRVLCVLDDLDTRRKGRLVQFTEFPDRLLPVDARANDRDTGLLHIGPRRNWHYSTALFPDPQQLIIRAEQLIASARRVQSIGEQSGYRPGAADVDPAAVHRLASAPDRSPSPPRSPIKHTILYVAANPLDTNRLALDEECAAFEREFRMTAGRDDIDFRSKWAVSVDELMRHLSELQPTVLHFSGHGTGSSVRTGGPQRELRGARGAGILLQDGQSRQYVSGRALAKMIASAAPSTRVVVLNACYSAEVADSLRREVDCVVGIDDAVADTAARSFAMAFYRALGHRLSIGNAVDQAAATLEGKHPGARPLCVTRDGLRADQIFLPAVEHSQRDPESLQARTVASMQPSGPSEVDIGILTILYEEFRAVLAAFPDRLGVFKGARTNREYSLHRADVGGGANYTLALLRQIEQGNGEAQNAARDLIEDLAPRLILVVGIAGGVPSGNVMLGDVVLSTRIRDFTVEARTADEAPTYSTTGGPGSKALATAIVNLPAREAELGSWTQGLPAPPPVSWTEKGQLYGPKDWQTALRAMLEHHYRGETGPRAPIYVDGPIASSDRLVKDPTLLIPWLQATRKLIAVEMESGGVYRAAQDRCSMLAIRGISDIVGLKRSDAWTKYACASAAAFTRAFLRTRPIEVTAATDSAIESSHARSKTDPTQTRHDPYVASPQTGETRMNADDLLTLLSKLLPTQFDAVLFRSNVPGEYIPGPTAPQIERAIATIRYFELQHRLDQLVRAVQQVVTEDGVGTDPR